ncbi:MAG: Ribonuclease HI, partial [uncultured Gemmatimonadaceae bacterium]
ELPLPAGGDLRRRVVSGQREEGGHAGRRRRARRVPPPRERGSRAARLLDLRALDDEQPDGAAVGDRGDAGAVAEGRALLGGVHQRLALPHRRDDRLGARVGAARLDAEDRPDREPRAVEGGAVGARRARGGVALGEGARGARAERVRQPPGHAGGGAADRLRGARGVGVRGLAHHAAAQGRGQREPRPLPRAGLVQGGAGVTGGFGGAYV